jgi:lambda repressor-like predicted transcriptional regulator
MKAERRPYLPGSNNIQARPATVRLLAACAARGWSPFQLAREAGISLSELRDLLCGRPVRPCTAWKVADAFDPVSGGNEEE